MLRGFGIWMTQKKRKYGNQYWCIIELSDFILVYSNYICCNYISLVCRWTTCSSLKLFLTGKELFFLMLKKNFEVIGNQLWLWISLLASSVIQDFYLCPSGHISLCWMHKCIFWPVYRVCYIRNTVFIVASRNRPRRKKIQPKSRNKC